ncbi:unnamed protein product [Rotaria sordida]|uniref:Uncharacterized protein n=1 Tax=Rotaria sordida TaxID=392033 RepID=A0A814T8B1_9BILA|nr:unnamed protein product [Rotaria sordida]CAF1100429.1 unnamed protein product [Rotaria sordida]CAF1154840.1 unnamed protein product [Rotaria sordida]CAF1232721.1 unnamed protein product [Rotaria sordida]CAF3492783.1 unnamed protein product [Rotaria sordida]
MSGYVTVNRLSLVQLHTEERKQQAHLKKIAEMQRRAGIDNRKPAYFPHRNISFNKHEKQKYRDIANENYVKSKKLIDIMQSKAVYPPSSSFHSTNSNRYRRPSLTLSQNKTDYAEKISKVKGIYDVRKWKQGFEEHKEHLKISKNNKLFTPRDIGVNRQRIKINSVANTGQSTVSSSKNNLHHSFDNHD